MAHLFTPQSRITQLYAPFSGSHNLANPDLPPTRCLPPSSLVLFHGIG